MQTPPEMEPIPTITTHIDWGIVMYLATSSTLGLISSLTALLGEDKRELNLRSVMAYLIAGAITSLGLTFFLVTQYGFSYFLLGVSIFAGYKAFDTLAMIGMALSNLYNKFISRKEDQ